MSYRPLLLVTSSGLTILLWTATCSPRTANQSTGSVNLIAESRSSLWPAIRQSGSIFGVLG